MTDADWMHVADIYRGVAEIPGKGHNSTIIGWLDRLGAWWRDDETPWCGAYTAYCLKVTGHSVPKLWMRAREWANWGVPLSRPAYGCVVVFGRDGGGHVGFVVGRDKAGNLMVLGGNQGNRVSVAAFPVSRVIGYRWPDNTNIPSLASLPLLVSSAQLSRNEA